MRRWRSRIAVASAMALIAGFIVATPVVQAPSASAAVAADFDPGMIVSDQAFFDGNAMTAAQVQTFLTSKHPGCATGYTCLPGYAQSTPSMPADAYCAALPGRSSETAASIIARVGAACGISQRFLIVLLEKEQSLVTLRDPSATRYTKATGFGCPDTAPCDPSVGGFFYQVYYGARQFQRYAAHPNNYNHRAGVVNNVLYNPNARCGSSPVLIRNVATAGLYNYTPYQPNAAALANLYGTGDSCSAYGNRNTWRIWTDWFGDPRQGGTAQLSPLVRDVTNGKVYLLVGTTRHHVPSREILGDYAPALGQSRDVSAAMIATYREGAPLTRVVQAADGSMQLVDDGVRHRFSSCGQVQAFGFPCTGHARLDAAVQSRLREGDRVAAIVLGTDGHDWLIQSSSRRELADSSVPTRYGYSSETIVLDADVIGHLPVGDPVLESGSAVRDQASTVVRIRTERGNVGLTQVQASLPAMRSLPVFTAESLARLSPGGGTIASSRLRDASGSYLLTDGGMLRIDPLKYGGTGLFPTRSDMPSIRAALPSAGAQTGPHFVQEQGSSLRYLASNAELQPVADDAAYEFLRSRFGVPARVWLVPSGTLLGVPKVIDVRVGDLLSGTDGRVHLWDGVRAIHVQHPVFGRALGLDWSVRSVGDDVIAALPKGPAMAGFGFRCGSTDLVATGGVLRPYASATVATGWRLTHVQLDPALCAGLTISTAPVQQFVVDPGGRTYYMQNGQARYVPSRAILTELGGSLSGRTQMPAAEIALLPKGSDVPPALPVGTWARASNGRVYLWDGVRAMHVQHAELGRALGIGWTMRAVPGEVIAQLPSGPAIAGFGFRCGSTDLVATGGVLRPYASATVAAGWRLTHVALSPAMCAQLSISTTPVMQFVVDPSGRTYLLQNGQARYVPNRTILTQLGGSLSGRTPMPAAAIALLPAGPSF